MLGLLQVFGWAGRRGGEQKRKQPFSILRVLAAREMPREKKEKKTRQAVPVAQMIKKQ